MHTTFGARLRAQREGRHIELATIAERTKIKASLLEALERDDVSRWPGGVFRRAYIRAYAQAIGLDAETIVQEFLTLYPEPTDAPEEHLDRAADNSRRPPTRIQFLLGSAMSGLLRPRRGAPSSPAGARHTPATTRAELRAEPVLRAHELSALAGLCSRVARAPSDDLPKVLRDVARLLNAAAISLWIRAPGSAVLRPELTYGYSPEVLARLSAVSLDADNALAAAFRTQARCIVPGSNVATGAVVMPLPTPEGCPGVLAVEFRNGGEHRECECAIIAILAAQLSTRVPTPHVHHAQVRGVIRPSDRRWP
jgi:transcriptional regulator with XRE-family HTH domain